MSRVSAGRTAAGTGGQRPDRRLWGRLARTALAACVAAGMALAGGFWWFVRVAESPLAPPAHADGIVVLTGGADRVQTGLDLLVAGRAPHLLVSGVAPGSELPELARLAGIDAATLAARIELGHTANSTLGNARETRDWVRRHDIQSLMVVTAGYHMPRALIELRRTLPGVTLYPVPVRSPALRRGNDFATLRLLAEEYVKYLGAEIGLSRLIPPRLRPGTAPLMTRLLPFRQVAGPPPVRL